MNEVFEKTRELGEAILRSEEYTTMKQMEDRALQNEEAAKALSMYLETRQQLEELMQDVEPDMDELKRLSLEMDAYQEKMREITEVAELTKARERFSGLVNQVNQVLRFLITGEMGDGNGNGGCTGSCDSCGSQCRTLH